MLNFDTPIHHDLEAEIFGDLGRLVGPDAQLQPEVFGANLGGLIGDIGGVFGATEHIDHVNLDGNVRQRRVNLMSQNGAALCGQDGVDEIYVVGRRRQQVGRDEI